MLKRKSLLYIPALMPGVILCLSSCAKTNYEYCPVYPVAGPKVATELENIEYNRASAFWEWLARIDKLRQELELCK